jgi:hypothetical protein
VKRSPHLACCSLGVERFGDRQRVRVDLDDRAQLRSSPVEQVDLSQVLLGERPRRVLARSDAGLELLDRRLLDLEFGNAVHARGGLGRTAKRTRDREGPARGAVAEQSAAVQLPGGPPALTHRISSS